MPDITAFVSALPKVELHLHLLGSASIDTVLELARRYPDGGVPTAPERLAKFYEFRDFPHFLEVYDAVNDLVRTGEDVRTLIRGLARDAVGSNVRYAEVTVTARSQLRRGLDADELTEALDRGRRDALERYGVRLNWVIDIPGESGQDAAWETVAYALRHRPPGLVALGLAGREVGVGRAQFHRQFGVAREAGLHAVPHAGETTGPASVWSAIDDLGAERIGHGIGGVTDPRLLAVLRERGIVVELCPTSNVRTRAVEMWEHHPLPRFLEHGVPVTLSSDDPGMFGTSLNQEYLQAATTFGFSRSELAYLARIGIEAAFCDEELRRDLLAELETLVS